MKKHFLLFLTIIPFITIAQDNDETIRWSSDKKLTWNDYKGKPERGTDAAASTATYLGIDYKMNKEGFSYTITSSFSKKKSWGLHKTAYILAHEQGHFDIAEVFARKLNKKMSSYVFNKNTYEKELGKIYKDILEEKQALQNKYDDETNHSINKEKQTEWLKKIEKMLEELDAFKHY